MQLYPTAGGVASVGARVTFSSPDENARAGETAPKFQYQPTLATPLVGVSLFISAIFPPNLCFIRQITAIYLARISLYFVPFFSPNFSKTPASTRNSKSRVAVLSEVSQINWYVLLLINSFSLQ